MAEHSHPSHAELLADFGEEYLSIQSLFRFCFVPGGRLNLLRELTPDEEWGANNFVLLKYLAVHVRLAIEQERYVWNGDQIVLTAGLLSNSASVPLYLGLVKNSTPDENPWVMNWVGERPSCPELPEPPNVGSWAALDPGFEVIIACDLSSEERRIRLPEIQRANPVIQSAAISGAVTWAIHRGLAVRQLHGGGRGYFVPIYLSSREDLTLAPNFVAPILIQKERVVVRTLLEPSVAYSPARAVVERWEQLPAWLLDAWDNVTDESSEGSAEQGAEDSGDGDSE